MEADRYVRTPVNIDADIIVDGNTFSGNTENISASGMCIVTTLAKDDIESLTKNSANISLRPLSERMMLLKCKIAWIRQDAVSETESVCKVGVEITNPSVDFDVFIKHLTRNHNSD